MRIKINIYIIFFANYSLKLCKWVPEDKKFGNDCFRGNLMFELYTQTWRSLLF